MLNNHIPHIWGKIEDFEILEARYKSPLGFGFWRCNILIGIALQNAIGSNYNWKHYEIYKVKRIKDNKIFIRQENLF